MTPEYRPAWRNIRSGMRWLVVTLAWIAASLTLIFVVLDLLPGDAANLRLGLDATAEELAALRAHYGLDRPLTTRLLEWFTGLLSGDLGTTLVTGVPVVTVIGGALGRTAVLAGLSVIGILLLGWGGGIAAGMRPGGRVDRILSSTALAALCTPEFVVATVLVLVLATGLGWLPAVSLVPAGGGIFDRPQILVLPVLTIWVVGSATLVRLVRPVIARQAASPHVEAAHLAGLSPVRVLWRHLLPGALAPAAQASAMLVPYLVGGTIIVERAFAFPGLGSVMVQAVSNREPGLLMACSLIVVGVTVVAYRLADLSTTGSAKTGRQRVPTRPRFVTDGPSLAVSGARQ
ncbi:ABC transporter permease [Brooklawnia sp.]|uniref:ABC transporter permease n=1 Tax=Brooklawnia sp. TaxID=2699740 RepID=UPI003120049C